MTKLQKRKIKEQRLEIAKLRSEVWFSNQIRQTVARRLLKLTRQQNGYGTSRNKGHGE